MKQIAIVGKPFRNFTSYIRVAHPEIELIGLRDKMDNFTYPKNVKRVYDLDLSSKESVEREIKKIPTHNIIGLESQYENGVLAKAWIAEILGLPSIEEEAALAATDKLLMRTRFHEINPKITPAFSFAESERDIKEFAQKSGFPLILKPANLAKSLLVTKNRNLEELLQNFSIAQSNIKKLYKKYGVHHRSPRMIVEEFMEGKFYSVDLFVDSDKRVSALPSVELVMASEIGINDNYNYVRKLPSGLKVSEEQALKNTAEEGALALGLSNSAAHCEMVFTKKGPKIIEIGARVGGYRSKMYNLSYGVNMYENIYKLAVGERVDITPEFKLYSAVYELFPDKSGKFASITNSEKLNSLESFISIKTPAKPGDEIGLSKDGFKHAANITIAHEDKDIFEKDCRFVEKKVKVKLV